MRSPLAQSDVQQEVTEVATLAGVIRRAAKVSLLVAAAAMVTLVLARDARPAAGAATTQIIISKSNTAPDPVTSLVFYRDGPPVNLYVWAKDVKDNLGAASFEVYFTYNNDLLQVTALTQNTTWLASTGRQVNCTPPWWATAPPYVHPTDDPDDPAWQWEGQVGCETLDGSPPPFGPMCPGQCTGLLASLTVQPRSPQPPVNTTLNFAVPSGNPIVTYRTWIFDTGYFAGGPVTEPSEIQASVPNINVNIVKCANFDGIGPVDLFNDILGVIARWNMRSSDPGWNPIYDLDSNGAIDLFNDILGTIVQWNMECTP